MKKINFLFMLMLALTVGIFSSCTDDEIDPPTIVVTVEGTPSYEKGTEVVYHLVIAGNEDLFDFWADPSSTGTVAPVISNISPTDAFDDLVALEFKKNLTKVEFDYTYTIPTSVGVDTEIKITFEVTDKKDNVTKKEMTFTVVSGAGAIDRFTAVLMGAQDNTTDGSFLDVSANNVMLQAAASVAQGSVDMVFYYGVTNKATICAPNDVTVGGGAASFALCEGWTTKNPTKFGASTVTAAEFTAMNDDAMLSSISGLSASLMKDLAVGDIFAFTTVDDKNGLVKVSALTAAANGKITLDIVIQK